jgi:hypothetical protein
MKVLELKQALENMPQDAEVVLFAPYDGDYELNMVELDLSTEHSKQIVRVYSL